MLIIDYCGIREKYDFLRALGAGLAPRALVIADGYRGYTTDNTIKGTKVAKIVKLPVSVYKSSWLADLLRRLRSVPAPLASRICELSDRLAALTHERDENASSALAKRNLLEAFRFTEKLVQRLDPAMIIIWNQFHPLSVIAHMVAEQHQIKTAFIEYGLLPGTLNFDLCGQMGESEVARWPEIFNSKSINGNDIDTAAQVVRDLRKSGVNRRPQMQPTDLMKELEARAKGRPIILFAGHNDHASGISPYDEKVKTLHSPIFQNSYQAANHLAELAGKNGWFIVYKPHPFAQKAQRVQQSNDIAVIGNVDVNACIDIATCVITVLSQVSYVSLIREKPLVMLGYNQLRGKGCIYQAETISDIVPCIRAAVDDGITPEQRAAWINHVARLLKYYLYQFDGHAPILAQARPPEALVPILQQSVALEASLSGLCPITY